MILHPKLYIFLCNLSPSNEANSQAEPIFIFALLQADEIGMYRKGQPRQAYKQLNM